MLPVRVYYKPELPKVEEEEVELLSSEMRALFARILDIKSLKQDILYLRKRGVSINFLARMLRTHRISIYRWYTGKRRPKDMARVIVIREIAKMCRDKERQERERLKHVNPKVVQGKPAIDDGEPEDND